MTAVFSQDLLSKSIFKWEELAGKELLIHVGSVPDELGKGEHICVMGMDKTTGKCYVLVNELRGVLRMNIKSEWFDKFEEAFKDYLESETFTTDEKALVLTEEILDLLPPLQNAYYSQVKAKIQCLIIKVLESDK